MRTNHDTRAAGLIAAAALALGLTACGVPDPTFRLTSVRQLERTDTALVLEFAIEATNPGEEEIPLKEVRYALAIDGDQVFEGTRTAGISVRGFGTQSFTLPAVITADELTDPGLTRFDTTGEAIAYDLSGRVEYLTPGQLAEVLFDTGLRRTRATLDLGGEFEITDPSTDPIVGNGEPR